VYLSFFLDSASAPTIVLLLTIAFVAVFIRSSRAARAQSGSLATGKEAQLRSIS